MLQLKHIKQAVYLLSLFCLNTAFAQQNFITIDTPDSGVKSYKACQRVTFNPGYTFTADANNRMEAYTPYVSCNGQYPPDNTSTENIRQLDLSKEIGSTKAQFTVSETGAAVYSIPIFVSPGTAGMQPNLSINYNSQGGNGLLGMGFQLGGLSAITRTGKKIYNHGEKSGVNLDANDQFSLDGNLLIVTNGNYGANNSTYRTEAESYRLIISSSTTGSSSPTSFTVKGKDGSITEYGGTSDSRIIASGSSNVIFWLINKVTDINGNYILFNYNVNPSNLEWTISKINYTGNETTNLSPYNEIEFEYIDRTDVQNAFIGGKEIKETKLLSQINCKNNSNIIRKYKFEYIENFYTHLTKVSEFGKNDESYNSTEIKWYESTPDVSFIENANITPVANAEDYLTGDYDNDGKSDVVLISPISTPITSFLYWSSFINNSGNNFSPSASGSLAYYNGEWSKIDKNFGIIDFDADGKQDIGFTALAPNESTFNKIVFNGGGEINWTDNFLTTQAYGDFDGDGGTDIIYFDETTVGVRSLQIASFLGQQKTIIDVSNINSSIISNWSNVGFDSFDFNGDGKHDLWVKNGATSYLYEFQKSINPANQLPTLELKLMWSGVLPYTYYQGDFNGDGKTDLYCSTNTGLNIYYSTGTGFTILAAPHQGGVFAKTRIDDFNGDGKSDICLLSTDKVEIFYSKGNNYFSYERDLFDQELIINKVFTGDFNGDGKKELFLSPALDNNFPINNIQVPKIIYFHPYEHKQNVERIIDGSNRSNQIKYVSLSNKTDYVKYTNASYPVADITPNSLVVEETKTDDGIGGNIIVNYAYEGAKVHLLGRGFLGFKVTKSNNLVTNINIENTFAFNAPYYVPYLSSRHIKHNSDIIKAEEFVYNIQNTSYGGFLKYLQFTNSRNFINNILESTETTIDPLKGDITNQNSFVGFYGQAPTQTTQITNLWQSTSQNGWFTSQLQSSTSTSLRTGDQTVNKITKYSDYTSTGLPQKIENNFGTNLVTTNLLTYDSYGNVVQASVSGYQVTLRTNSYTYDNQGRFIIKTTNSLTHFTESTYDNGYGLPLIVTDENGLKTIYTYNGLGRLLTKKTPTNQTINYSQSWSIDFPTSNCLYSTTVETSGEAPSTSYYDSFGRTIREQSKSFNGQDLTKDYSYNAKGQLITESHAYVSGDGILNNSYTYDDYGRIVTLNAINFTTTSYDYPSGSTIVNTQHNLNDGRVRNYTTETDALGLTTKSTDAGGVITYQYNSFGKPKSITAVGVTTTMQYNNIGLQIELTEPNAGTTTYEYSALGELTKQTDAKGTYDITYDKLGRIDTKTNSVEGTVIYSYDGANAKGLIRNISNSGSGSTINYTYDALSRLINQTENIDTRTFSYSFTYDANSRVNVMTYPSGFKIKNEYNTNGYLTAIKNNVNSQLIWQCNEMNKFGKVTKAQYGNGIINNLSYDGWGFLETDNHSKGANVLLNNSYYFEEATGNLMQRADLKRNLYETFDYDELDRLTNINNASPINYAQNGNINSKAEVGSYNYAPPIGMPHAVKNITSPQNISLLQQDILYTTFNKAERITEGNRRYIFNYGVDQQRNKVQMYELTNNGANQTLLNTRYYAGATELDVNATTNATRRLEYISSPNGLVAIHVVNSTAMQDSMYYIGTDHLGSVILITNQAGTIVQERSYDAWGRLRNPNNWTYSGVEALKVTERGYTGHEHLQAFKLINMNGRLYDPIVGRMLSPDNYVQVPEFTQSYNRYSYCWNNPLKYTDPTGDKVNIDNPFRKVGRWQDNPDVVRGPHGYPIGPYGEYNAFGGYYNDDPLESGYTQGNFIAADGNSYQYQTNVSVETSYIRNVRDFSVQQVNTVVNNSGYVQTGDGNNGWPTIDKGGFIDNYNDFKTFMYTQAKSNPKEVSAFGLSDGRFFVQSWKNNYSDQSFNDPANIPNYGNGEFQIISLYHTHPISSGTGDADAETSNTYNIPVYSMGANGNMWKVYIPQPLKVVKFYPSKTGIYQGEEILSPSKIK